MSSKKFVMWDPFTGTRRTFKSPYKRTPMNLMKRMILEMNYPKDILPPGVKIKNGLLYLKGKRGKTRADKIRKLEQRHNFKNLTRIVEKKLAASQNVKIKKVDSFKKKLKTGYIEFVPQERLRDKFNMVEIYLKLKRPTADHKKALSLLKKYLKKKISALKGHEIYMKLDFKDVYLDYFNGKIDVKDFDDTYDHLSNSIESWALDQQEYEKKEQFKLAGMRIFVMVNKGGDYNQFPHLPGFSARDLRSKIYCPIVSSIKMPIFCLNALRYISAYDLIVRFILSTIGASFTA